MDTAKSKPYPPGEALLAAYRARGPVIPAGIGGHGYTFLLGAEANKFVFANSEAFSWAETFEILVPTDGRTALIVSDGPQHRKRRGAVAPALHHRKVGDYVQTMVANIDAVIDTWRQGQRLDVCPPLRSVIRRNIAESLYGSRMAAHADTLGEYLQPLLDLTHEPPQMLRLRQRLHAPSWRRARAAQARVDDLVYAEMADARRNPRPDDHLLTALIDFRDDDGQSLSDTEIRDLVVSLIADGYETASGAMAWAVHALLTVPGAWEAATDEVARVLGRRAPSAADVNALTYLNGVVHETLRLYTPGVISARKVKRDLDFDGHRIQAGRMLIFSPYVTHRIPQIWPRPREFRPERWDPTSPDYRRPGPHEFIPFSGGQHRCIGSVLATTEMTVILARLIARTTLTLPPQRIRARNFAALRPLPGMTVDVAAISAR